MASASGVSHRVKLPHRRNPASYSGQFVTLNFILPMRWRRAALCLKGIKVTDRLLRLPIAYTTTAKRSVHQRADVFVPQELQRHVLALELAMDLRPVRLRAPTVTRLRPGRLVKRRFQDGIADVVTQRQESPAICTRPNVSRTVDGAAPTLTAIDLWPSPCSKRYLNISRTRRISSLSAGIPFRPRHRRRKELHTSRTPTPDAVRRGRHHLGIRGRIASEFAGQCIFLSTALDCRSTARAQWRSMAPDPAVVGESCMWHWMPIAARSLHIR